MSIQSVVGRGFGSFGGIAFVPTLGFSIGISAVNMVFASFDIEPSVAFRIGPSLEPAAKIESTGLRPSVAVETHLSVEL